MTNPDQPDQPDQRDQPDQPEPAKPTDHAFHIPDQPARQRPGAHRTEQLASTIRTELDRVMARGLSDPRIKGRITITGVEVTQDLRLAKIAVSVLPPEHTDLTMHGLRSASGYLRNQIKERIAARLMPRLEFTPDEGLARQREIYELLAKAAAERTESAPDHADDTDPDGAANNAGRDDTGTDRANHPQSSDG